MKRGFRIQDSGFRPALRAALPLALVALALFPLAGSSRLAPLWARRATFYALNRFSPALADQLFSTHIVDIVARHPKPGCADTARCGEIFYHWNSHNLRVNAGINWQADIMSSTGTPAVNAQCNYLALSNDATAPAAGDTAVAVEITTNGLARAQGTYAHTSNATSYTVSHLWTATAAQSAQKAGMLTAASLGTLCFENTFTQVSLQTNDTLTLTWTINF